MTERIFNFSAGPAIMPVPVLEEAQKDLLALPELESLLEAQEPGAPNPRY